MSIGGINLSNISLSSIKNSLDEVRAQVYPKNETERKVYEALSSKNWGASATLMNDIAAETFDYEKYKQITAIIFGNLETDGKTWKHIFKTLTLIDHLIKNGAERFIEECRDRLFKIRVLQDYNFYEGTIDKGSGVREKAKLVVELLGSNEMIRTEREKARVLRNKLVGIESRTGFGGSGSGGYGGEYNSRYESDRPYDSRDSYSNGGGSGGGSGNTGRYGGGAYDSNRPPRYGDDAPSSSNNNNNSYSGDDYRGGGSNNNNNSYRDNDSYGGNNNNNRSDNNYNNNNGNSRSTTSRYAAEDDFGSNNNNNSNDDAFANEYGGRSSKTSTSPMAGGGGGGADSGSKGGKLKVSIKSKAASSAPVAAPAPEVNLFDVSGTNDDFLTSDPFNNNSRTTTNTNTASFDPFNTSTAPAAPASIAAAAFDPFGPGPAAPSASNASAMSAFPPAAPAAQAFDPFAAAPAPVPMQQMSNNAFPLQQHQQVQQPMMSGGGMNMGMGMNNMGGMPQQQQPPMQQSMGYNNNNNNNNGMMPQQQGMMMQQQQQQAPQSTYMRPALGNNHQQSISATASNDAEFGDFTGSAPSTAKPADKWGELGSLVNLSKIEKNEDMKQKQLAAQQQAANGGRGGFGNDSFAGLDGFSKTPQGMSNVPRPMGSYGGGYTAPMGAQAVRPMMPMGGAPNMGGGMNMGMGGPVPMGGPNMGFPGPSVMGQPNMYGQPAPYMGGGGGMYGGAAPMGGYNTMGNNNMYPNAGGMMPPAGGGMMGGGNAGYGQYPQQRGGF